MYDTELKELSKAELIRIIPQKKQNLIKELCQAFADAGFECFMVGGAVRDLLLNKAVHDLDFATNAHPDQVQKIFRRTIPTGIKHGTITVRIGEQSFEVTTYRSESVYQDARHPDSIEFSSSLAEDLSRRDFTINALAYDPLKGKLIDGYHGLRDLQNKVIRAIGKAKERFYEDGLRPVRACRFASVLEFSIEKETYAALSDSLIQKRVSQIAVERFSEELEKGLSANKASILINLLEKTGILFLFFDRERKKEKHTTDQELQKIDSLPADIPILRLAYWRYCLDAWTPEQITDLQQRLRLSRKKSRDLLFYCRYFHFQKELKAKITDKNLKQSLREDKILYLIRKFLSLVKKNYAKGSTAFLRQAGHYFSNGVPIQKLLEIYNNSSLVVNDLQINGNDLANMGFQGRQIGVALEELLDQVLCKPEVNEKAILRESALKISKT